MKKVGSIQALLIELIKFWLTYMGFTLSETFFWEFESNKNFGHFACLTFEEVGTQITIQICVLINSNRI